MLTLKLLGTPQIYFQDRPIEIKSLKARALLFYVALADAPVPRETLVALLWPDSAESTARSNLRTQLATLRKKLPDQVVTTRQTVTLSDEVDVDALRFCRDVTNAIGLYRGAFLTGFNVPDSAEFTYWQTEQREYLRLLAIDTHAALAEQLEQTDPNSAIQHARDWISLAPLQEAAHRSLMRLLLATGDRPAALQQYETCAHLLHTELQIAPSAETQALHAQLQHALEPPRSQVTSHNLPLTIRKSLLSKLKAFWLDTVLTDNVHPDATIQVDFTQEPQQIDHPWADTLGAHFLTTQTVTGLIGLSQRSHHRLLILGEPGSGKTINLLQLARHLHDAAVDDAQATLPVVLHLASWANERASLAAWIVAEMKAKYQVPPDSAETWLTQSNLTLLLDGLDEMQPAAIPDCIAAINTFCQQHSQAGVVVCCRSADYARAERKLALGAAVKLQPLTRRQIDRYLARSSADTRLRAVLLSERDNPLHDLAQSPMLLNLLRSVGQSGDTVATSQTLIAHYVDHAFQRKPSSADHEHQLRRTLSWLADNMRSNNQAVFLIEELQPSWLKQPRQRMAYMFITRAILATISAFCFSIALIYMWYRTDYALESSMFRSIADGLGLGYPVAALLGFLLISALSFVIGAPREYWLWERQMRHDSAESALSWRETLIQSMLIFAVTFGTFASFGDWLIGAVMGIILAFARGGSSQTWMNGSSYINDIQQADKIAWSWRKALLGLPIGAMHGLVWIVAVPGLPDWWDLPCAMLLFVFILGLKGVGIDNKTQPNHGTWLALRNGLLMGAIVASMVGALIALYAQWQAAAVMSVSVFMAMYLVQGGMNAIKHAVLRLLLQTTEQTPLNFASDLDQICSFGLLQRLGGGYVFRHRLILDHFADTTTP